MWVVLLILIESLANEVYLNEEKSKKKDIKEEFKKLGNKKFIFLNDV